MLELKLLLLLIAANATPVLLRYALKEFGNKPIDFGVTLGDGYRLLGDSKTWRGLIGAVLVALLIGLLFCLPAAVALAIGLLAMGGDLISSFIKRRMGKAASSKMTLLDQVPESLLPLLFAKAMLGISWFAVAWVCVVFVLLNMFLSPLLFQLGVRRKPY